MTAGGIFKPGVRELFDPDQARHATGDGLAPVRVEALGIAECAQRGACYLVHADAMQNHLGEPAEIAKPVLRTTVPKTAIRAVN